MDRGVIWCLHGFLGLPTDWDFLREAGFDIRTLDLYHDDFFVQLHRAAADDVLLGYSMGGRIALQSLIDGAPFKRAVIVSSSVGVTDDDARMARRGADDRWAKRFEREEWDRVMRDWDGQPMFSGQRVPRQESSYDKSSLADTIRKLSPAVLPPLEPHLSEINARVLWIAGENDRRYVSEADRAMELLPNGKIWICPGAAHRVPWEQREAFIEALRGFLSLSE